MEAVSRGSRWQVVGSKIYTLGGEVFDLDALELLEMLLEPLHVLDCEVVRRSTELELVQVLVVSALVALQVDVGDAA